MGILKVHKMVVKYICCVLCTVGNLILAVLQINVE